MKRFYPIHTILLAITALALGAPARAALPYCADTAGEIVSDIGNANGGAEGTTQEIRIVRGTYNITQTLEFKPAGEKDNKNFTLSGGWSAGCADGTQIVDPDKTILNFTAAASDSRKVNLEGDNASYRVEGIRFVGFSEFRIEDHDCSLFDSCPDTETISLRYNEFRNGNHVTIYANDARTVVVKNNLFDHFNGYSALGGLVSLIYRNNETAPDVAFNTFGSMSCQSSENSAFVFYSEKDNALLHHNVFDSANCKADLEVLADLGVSSFNNGNPVSLRKNVYQKRAGLTPISALDLVNVDPGFADPAGYDFRLRATLPASALIDAGMTPAELIVSGLIPPGRDLDAGARFAGVRYDPGAYESPGAVADTYTVINTNDNGTGSLRDAIQKANQKAGRQTITFNIPGACPHKVGLVTSLDDIVDDLEIDGYTQPGSVMNSAKIGTNAVLCVVVGPASGNIQHSFQVPDTAPDTTQLTVSGIAFTGGHSIAVDLSGGSGHYVWGNAFGGVRPGTLNEQLGNTNLSHLAARGNALGAQIGGDEYRERNYFGSSQLNALLLLNGTSGGHTVQGNYIGLDPGGGYAQPLGGNAVSAQDSAGNRILGNVIAAADAGIRISGATATGYVIQGNTFGMDAYGGAGALSANEEGILITNGSGGHIIGSTSGKTLSNTITNSRKAGVWIDATAGTGTIVRPNSVYNNGTSGLGLGIDLGALGPLPNDDKDPDGSGNTSQNKPFLKGTAPGSVKGGLNSNVGATFRIDVYRAPSCAGGDRGGDAKTSAGTFTVTTDANGKVYFSSVINSGTPGFLTATATNTANGNTSEIGACLSEDVIFRDGQEPGL